MKIELRKGSVDTSNNGVAFLEPVLQWFRSKFPNIQLILWGDSGFAIPKLYELLEDFDVSYVIRLKLNAKLSACSRAADKEFNANDGTDYSKSYRLYHDFTYQAGSWDKSRRVACRIERNANELCPRHTFIVTNLMAHPQEVIGVYHKRGQIG